MTEDALFSLATLSSPLAALICSFLNTRDHLRLSAVSPTLHEAASSAASWPPTVRLLNGLPYWSLAHLRPTALEFGHNARSDAIDLRFLRGGPAVHSLTSLQVDRGVPVAVPQLAPLAGLRALRRLELSLRWSHHDAVLLEAEVVALADLSLPAIEVRCAARLCLI